MKESHYKTWIEKFGVTAPIKNIMGCIDELEASYERRLAAMHGEYKQDVEAIVECYKDEKQRFLNLSKEQDVQIMSLEANLNEKQKLYKNEKIAHDITRGELETIKSELAILSDALKSEQELIAITKQRIKAAEEQMKIALDNKPAAKTRSFFMQVFEARSKSDDPKSEHQLDQPKQDPAIDTN